MNTLLITNQDDVKQKFQDNLVLLRGSDKVITASYGEAPDVLYEIRPEIIILHEHENREKTAGMIKYIREKKLYSASQILLVANSYDKAFILAAYDAGITDYITVKSDPSEILIRTINCIKKSDMAGKISLLSENLRTYGILDTKTDFYTEKYEKDVFDVRLHMDNYKGGCYIIISPDISAMKDGAAENLVIAIRKSVRIGDMVAVLAGSKYSIMVKTGLEGAIRIYEKIAEELQNEITLSAGIAVIDTEKFNEVRNKAVSALNNAKLQGGGYYVYSQDDTSGSEDWLELPQEKNKTYKLFKNAFSKKIENVIAPIFYRTQKAYEEKIGNAKIEQFTDEQQSVFRIVSGKYESRLTMRYPRYAKLIIYITHSGLDTPDNREISLNMNQITESRIEEIMESFINEFIGIYRHIYNS